MLVINKARLRDCNSFLGYCLTTANLAFSKARLRDRKPSRHLFFASIAKFLISPPIQYKYIVTEGIFARYLGYITRLLT